MVARAHVFFGILYFVHFGIFPCGNSDRFSPRKASCNRVESLYLTLLNYEMHAGSFLCFRNPPNSDRDYGIYM